MCPVCFFPADIQRALKCGLAQQGVSLCKGRMLNVKGSGGHEIVPYQYRLKKVEEKKKEANPVIRYICSSEFMSL